MASTEDTLETYTQLPLEIDPVSKRISAPASCGQSVHDAVTVLNALHTSLKQLDTPNSIPPPPIPVNPKRSAQIAKMRETANAAYRKGHYVEAVRLWDFAIGMAIGRPGWEPMALARDELASLYLARANSSFAAQNWVEAFKDAECSTECRRGPATGPNGENIAGNPKAFVIAGKALLEMGRYHDAVEWLERAIEIEGREGEDGKELVRLLAQARKENEKLAA